MFGEKIQTAIRTHSYIGPKGFTIPKSILTTKEINKLYKKFTVKPFSPPTSLQKPKKFFIYRESNRKLYIPRVEGLSLFGNVENKLTSFERIDCPFNGSLREFQIPIVDRYISEPTQCGILELACGMGKTICALNIISRLSVKTIVIVHKEFLMNQWIERIEQFLPSARVGKIQGQIMDVENKDIVIGMLQSISMKEYPQSLFSQFGLAIVDECHHISAEVFSRSLFKIVCPHMLGLSATLNRKDGLTSVFKMFLGDVVYSKLARDEDYNVHVNAIQYIDDDDEFNRVEYNFKGHTHYSIMIRKLCDHEPRRMFIMCIIRDYLRENPDSQLMILAHNKSILTFLHDEVEREGFATVGYYVGGMKEEALKKTENKQVVIATYAMAEEALDIKTLSALILATPRSDVAQAVGRILRIKHERPTVIDIIDQHEIFQRQWGKRRAFYNKNKYPILNGTSTDYISSRTKSDFTFVSERYWTLKQKKKRKKVEGYGKCLIKM
jgi:superfamily II DNA or RNA helicase